MIANTDTSQMIESARRTAPLLAELRLVMQHDPQLWNMARNRLAAMSIKERIEFVLESLTDDEVRSLAESYGCTQK